MQGGIDICVTVTLLDGIVLARSGFHHSANSRSVMALGKATAVTDPEEKRMALDAIVDHIVPGRAADLEVRPSMLLSVLNSFLGCMIRLDQDQHSI